MSCLKMYNSETAVRCRLLSEDFSVVKFSGDEDIKERQKDAYTL